MSLRPRSSRASAGRLMATWLKRGCPDKSALRSVGRDEDLAGQLPGGESPHGVEEVAQGHVVGLDQEVGGKPPRVQHPHGDTETVVVVGVGAGDDKLVEEDAVVVEPRSL